MAAMASETALTKRTSQAVPLDRPRANITTIVSPAAATIHSVRRLSSLVSGDCSVTVVESIPEIFPSSVSVAVAVTIITPLPWVTGVFMKAMFTWSPGLIGLSASVVVSFCAGVLSPVSADSSICSALASTIRPSAGTSSPAARRTTSPVTTCSAGISDSTPSRLTRAVIFIIDLSAFIALSAFPSWRRPTTALRSVMMTRSTAVLHSLMASDTIAAPTRISCM